MIIYTDGATSNNGYDNATGGWGYVIVNDIENIVSENYGHIEPATNNLCELTALVNACKDAAAFPTTFIVYSDSAYAINCYTQKWYKNWLNNGWKNAKKQPVANKELWEQLIPYFENPNFKFVKVKGHAGNKWNEYVDELARRGVKNDLCN